MVNRIFRQPNGVFNVRGYLEVDIEAANKEQAIERFGEVVLKTLSTDPEIREIAEVEAEKISDGLLSE
jgi:hypothetical protein